MSVIRTSVHAKWVMGKVIGTVMVKTVKVKATRLVLDPYLLKYFNEQKTCFVHDAHQQSSVGNIVLLRALLVVRSKQAKHELAEIIFKVGRVIDPITGKSGAGTAYLESPLSSESANPSKTPEELIGQNVQAHGCTFATCSIFTPFLNVSEVLR
ncbi:28S ribosomal protein S17, mitochondrial-like [Chionomys nivalis]|uniref:28S ribosomal protein S17, mitochondrial-like n=1 Tax=Chionomys nivalis TaxID=269649 RepID=UPI00259458A6|nr:28S ribosomal protein S17, mitochondrial-like [Chionomys nivalis]